MSRDADFRAGRPRRPAGRAARAVAATALAVPLAGCGLLAGSDMDAPTIMSVSEGAFTRGVMPSRFTCAAAKPVSPPLAWAGAPSGTKSIAVVVDDSDAPITPYVYWLVFNIQPGTTALLEGHLPSGGAEQAKGTAGYASYDPPCPGRVGHSYRFTVYALNKVLDLPNGTSLQSAWQAIAAATIGRGRETVSATS